MKKHLKNIVVLITVTAILFSTSGCSKLLSSIQTLKGELIGNTYNIWEYDNFGEKVLSLKGNKVAIEGTVDTEGNNTSYLNITLDGREWQHVGNTLVFAQESADMITDFQLPKNLDTNTHSSGLIGIDRTINNYRNLFGKKSVVVVFSQTGAPICMFQGNDCYTEIPEDLPKTTLIYIDKSLVYVHRANVDIFPAELFE